MKYKNNKVYIQGPAYYSSTANVFKEYGYDIVDTIPECHFVVLTGGEDINPAIYNEPKHRTTYFNPRRDKVDISAIDEGISHEKFLLGICRGHQLLNCYLNNGKLIQDVDGHEYGVHEILDVETNKFRQVNSVHHQMCVPSSTAIEICKADRTSGEWSDNEGLYWPSTRSLGVQFHPEFGHPESSKYFFELLERYYHH